MFFFLPFSYGEVATRKGFQTEIILAVRPLDAVEERGEFDEFVPRIKKIEVEDLLLGHMFVGRKIER